MHVIIAGAARAGKTTTALKFKDKYVHYKMDSVKRGMCAAYGLKYVDWHVISPIMAKIILKIIEDNKTDTNFNKENYLFDIPHLYPKDVHDLNLKDTLVIFLGYPSISLEEEFNNIRKYDKENYWTYKLSDKKLKKWCEENIEFSKELKEECEKYNIKFFDTSYNRNQVIKEVCDYIKKHANINYTVEKVIEKLTLSNQTISTMESCTGGGVVNYITNIPGASEVIKFSAVTYSNEYKIKMGVDKKVIDKYSVYSINTAREMSKNISKFTSSDYGIGITGKLNRADAHNPYGDDNKVFVSIYRVKDKKYFDFEFDAILDSRKDNKKLVIDMIMKELNEVIE